MKSLISLLLALTSSLAIENSGQQKLVTIVTIHYCRIITDCFEREIDYFDNDIKRITTSSPKHCQIECQGVAHCRAWTFNGDNKNCFLKTSNSGKQASLPFVTSGPKYCIDGGK